MRRYIIVLVTASLLVVQGGAAVSAQSGDAGRTTEQFNETIQAYWEANGGAAVFGSPLGDAFEETQFATGASYTVQYFENQRFELHPNNSGTPYDVLLGRLGAEVLATTGRDWQEFRKDDPGQPNYHQATGFAIAPEFANYWSSHGLDVGDDEVSFRESLALFGYPISPAQTERDANGDEVLTQWFERARLEFRDREVTRGALGSELLDVPGVADPEMASMLAQVQRSVARYGDLDVATTGGWDLVEGLDHCFDNPGVGAMGIHYINAGMLDTLVDPLMPEAMVYQHGPDGELSFGAVEWIVPADAWDDEGHDGLPEVLGRSFHLNEDLGVYVLHAWLFLENPAGMFEDWNPNVSCPPDESDGLDDLRDAVAAYQDLDVAIDDGYALVEGLDHCFNNPGVGAMGVHYINTDLLDTTLDPLLPEAMVYQHGPDGDSSLGAVEWIVPTDAWDAEGHAGLPVVRGHELHLNEELGVYVLHAWLFLDNPAGTYEDWNPDVTCPE